MIDFFPNKFLIFGHFFPLQNIYKFTKVVLWKESIGISKECVSMKKKECVCCVSMLCCFFGCSTHCHNVINKTKKACIVIYYWLLVLCQVCVSVCGWYKQNKTKNEDDDDEWMNAKKKTENIINTNTQWENCKNQSAGFNNDNNKGARICFCCVFVFSYEYSAKYSVFESVFFIIWKLIQIN